MSKNINIKFCLVALFMMLIGEAHAQIAGVSCCDWMMLKRQKLGAVTLSKEIGADGLEMDMGSLGKRMLFVNRFRPAADSLTVGPKDYTDPANDIPVDRKTGIAEALIFKHTADSLGIKISSMAMSGFFAQNVLRRKFEPGFYMSDEDRIANYCALMQDCINTMKIFGTKVAFLPLGGSEHEWERPGCEAYYQMVERLRMFGKMFEKEGMILGVRTAMDAYFDLQFLKDIDCPAVKIYYNVQDACDRLDLPRNEGKPKSYGTDIVCRELKLLGAKNIVQIHISNTDAFRLREDPEVDLPRIRQTLDEIGYHGWLTVERSRSSKNTRDTRGNYGDNVAYIHEVFK